MGKRLLIYISIKKQIKDDMNIFGKIKEIYKIFYKFMVFICFDMFKNKKKEFLVGNFKHIIYKQYKLLINITSA